MATRLNRRSPSAAGVDAAGIDAFLDAIAEHETHSLMIVRRGDVIAEGFWRPYRPDEVHLIYSISKSFTSAALGYALTEGLLALDDHVVDLLDVADAPPTIAALTVRDLARMTTGHVTDQGFTWKGSVVDTLLAYPPDQEPGSVWVYNQWSTWLLAALIQQRSGVQLTEYLRPRLFEHLDIEDWAWNETGGLQHGFTGLHVQTESLAKFGHLLQRGGWLHRREVLNSDYLAEAVTKQADNSIDEHGRPRDAWPDWKLGYGYQFWMQRVGFRADGAFGQFILVLPAEETVVVMTGATDEMQSVLDAVWEHLLPAIDRSGSPEADAALADRLSSLELTPVSSCSYEQIASFASGPGNEAMGSVAHFGVAPLPGGVWELTLRFGDKVVSLLAGDREWIDGSYPGAPGLEDVPVASSAGWQDETTFVAEICALQGPHRVRVTGDLNTDTFSATWNYAPLEAATCLGHLGLPAGGRRH